MHHGGRIARLEARLLQLVPPPATPERSLTEANVEEFIEAIADGRRAGRQILVGGEHLPEVAYPPAGLSALERLHWMVAGDARPMPPRSS
jgi:hypothetical protein